MAETATNSEVAKALFEVQKLNLKAKKDTQAFNYTYADLEEVWTVLSKPLTANGLLVLQCPIRDTLVTTVTHVESGQFVISETPLITPDQSKNHMQDLGGAITYARRYALTSMFNIVTNDDDNSSSTTDKPVAKAAGPKPSDKQLNFARDLLTKAGYKQEAIDKRLEQITATDTKKLIENLLNKKRISHDSDRPEAD